MHSSVLSVEFLVSVIIIFISLGFCSSSTGSLPYGFQTHVVGCSLGRLFPFIPLYSGVNLRRQHPHLPTVGQHFSTLPFRDSILPQGGQNRVPSFLSQAYLHLWIIMDQQMALGQAASSPSEISPHFRPGRFLYFPNSSVTYFKTCF